MKTITVSAFTVLPPYSSDQEDTIAVALFSSKFPLRYGEHGIVLSARALATGSAGSVVITVGRGDHIRDFCVRLDVGKSAK